MERKKVKSNKRKGTYEECVLCKCKTTIKKDWPIEKRYGYVEGVGQLCYNCYKKLYEDS